MLTLTHPAGVQCQTSPFLDHLDAVEMFLQLTVRAMHVDQFPAQCHALHQAQEADDCVLELLDDKALHFAKTIVLACISEETIGGQHFPIHC